MFENIFTKILTENKEENRKPLGKLGIDFPNFQQDQPKEVGIAETKETKNMKKPLYQIF